MAQKRIRNLGLKSDRDHPTPEEKVEHKTPPKKPLVVVSQAATNRWSPFEPRLGTSTAGAHTHINHQPQPPATNRNGFGNLVTSHKRRPILSAVGVSFLLFGSTI